jgi:circadian clock protein KaiB
MHVRWENPPNEIGKTAARELSLNEITSLKQVARHSRKELLAIHGVGPKAVWVTFDSSPCRARCLDSGQAMSRGHESGGHEWVGLVPSLSGAVRSGEAMGAERAFRVFVAGSSWRSQRVVRALHELCAAHGVARYRVEVVDVLQDPVSAERDGVLALPMVLRVAPEPVARVVGDLSDVRLAAEVLGLLEPEADADDGGSP